MADPAKSPPLTRASVQAAHKRIAQYIHKTPVLTSTTISGFASSTEPITGVSGERPAQPKIRLFFKCENYQKVGAFKARGAFHALSRLSEEELAKGVVTHSSGESLSLEDDEGRYGERKLKVECSPFSLCAQEPMDLLSCSLANTVQPANIHHPKYPI
jgi:hypothetical protein